MTLLVVHLVKERTWKVEEWKKGQDSKAIVVGRWRCDAHFLFIDLMTSGLRWTWSHTCGRRFVESLHQMAAAWRHNWPD